jgi:hypothetical protein
MLKFWDGPWYQEPHLYQSFVLRHRALARVMNYGQGECLHKQSSGWLLEFHAVREAPVFRNRFREKSRCPAGIIAHFV